jgi:DNA-binding CsgD family transcriptional regulator
VPRCGFSSLTTYHADDAVYAALRAGASGFLLKDKAPDDLVAAVRAVAGGAAWLDPVVARGLLDEFAARPAEVLPAPVALAALTNREREVLALVAQGLSNGEISRQLVVGAATVKTHFGRILAKLGLRDRAQAVALATGPAWCRRSRPAVVRPLAGPPRRGRDRVTVAWILVGFLEFVALLAVGMGVLGRVHAEAGAKPSCTANRPPTWREGPRRRST